MPYGRYRAAFFKRPINSVKNIVDDTAIGVASGTQRVVTVAAGTNAYSGGVSEVPIGAKVSHVYIFAQMQPQAAQGDCDWYIWKGPGTLSAAMPTPGVTGGDNNRKYILHEEKGIPGVFNNGSNPLTFRGVIRIPRGRQRFGENDIIELRAVAPTVYDWCAKFIYKFYQ